jgi:hypothetical protein
VIVAGAAGLVFVCVHMTQVVSSARVYLFAL